MWSCIMRRRSLYDIVKKRRIKPFKMGHTSHNGAETCTRNLSLKT
jgi:hypothetical protein